MQLLDQQMNTKGKIWQERLRKKQKGHEKKKAAEKTGESIWHHRGKQSIILTEKDLFKQWVTCFCCPQD